MMEHSCVRVRNAFVHDFHPSRREWDAWSLWIEDLNQTINRKIDDRKEQLR
jgi:hypothetical protein